MVILLVQTRQVSKRGGGLDRAFGSVQLVRIKDFEKNGLRREELLRTDHEWGIAKVVHHLGNRDSLGSSPPPPPVSRPSLKAEGNFGMSTVTILLA